jgi:membrane fusion protein, copper/silver efflux system
MKKFILGFISALMLLAGGHFINTRLAISEKAGPVAALYHCPMHPTYTSDKPGDCPICGMKLVPIKPDRRPESSPQASAHQESASGTKSQVPGYASVTISPERIQSMGITLAAARRMDLDQDFRAYGRITYDETRVHHVHTKYEGFIEELFVDYVGRLVKRGEPLFRIYSPELYATENEYLLALRAREQMPILKGLDDTLNLTRGMDLVAAARQRLSLWDVQDDEIREIEKTRKPIRALTVNSPVSGYVTAKTAVHGLKVTPADNLFDIVDLSTVWVMADIYEVNLPFLKLGLPATMTLSYQPGKTWKGRVNYINPTLDPATRTVKARLDFANPANELKPEMYADVDIGGLKKFGITVPESAVMDTGERNIVFIAKGEGLFEPREVVLGVRVRGLCEIRQGVSEGEQVVTGANFLLDSESKLQAAVHRHGK